MWRDVIREKFVGIVICFRRRDRPGFFRDHAAQRPSGAAVRTCAARSRGRSRRCSRTGRELAATIGSVDEFSEAAAQFSARRVARTRRCRSTGSISATCHPAFATRPYTATRPVSRRPSSCRMPSALFQLRGMKRRMRWPTRPSSSTIFSSLFPIRTQASPRRRRSDARQTAATIFSH